MKYKRDQTILFLSTLSLRRATAAEEVICLECPYFYPRSPCGERPPQPPQGKSSKKISIHALLAESDRPKQPKHQTQTHFYPRSPCGERRRPRRLKSRRMVFLSTLSLRRATIISKANRCTTIPFLSTLSLRRATTHPIDVPVTVIFLSTLSLRRATGEAMPGIGHISYFYPRSPCGERHRAPPYNLMIHHTFLSTLSLRRATLFFGRDAAESRYFYPRSPCGERRSLYAL